uniref:Uncharacterized protein n=1 Tax=Trichobilharzia regenti TaxID=157069 RepID=A0AA85J9Q2_TRIRE|nr:unnamed protein product [Trichobilharzia regenti]
MTFRAQFIAHNHIKICGSYCFTNKILISTDSFKVGTYQYLRVNHNSPSFISKKLKRFGSIFFTIRHIFWLLLLNSKSTTDQKMCGGSTIDSLGITHKYMRRTPTADFQSRVPIDLSGIHREETH